MSVPKKGLPLIARGTEPHGSEEALSPNCFKTCKPKDLLGESDDRRTYRAQASLRWSDHEDTEEVVAELLFAFFGECQLEIVVYFLLPNGETFIAEINFKEYTDNSRRRLPFSVTIGNEAQSRKHWFVQWNPAPEEIG